MIQFIINTCMYFILHITIMVTKRDCQLTAWHTILVTFKLPLQTVCYLPKKFFFTNPSILTWLEEAAESDPVIESIVHILEEEGMERIKGIWSSFWRGLSCSLLSHNVCPNTSSKSLFSPSLLLLLLFPSACLCCWSKWCREAVELIWGMAKPLLIFNCSTSEEILKNFLGQ